MRKHYRRPYTLAEQEAFNQQCADNINQYWSQFGLEANARVERVLVKVHNAGESRDKTRNMWSEEIVSSVAQFPALKRQILGIVER